MSKDDDCSNVAKVYDTLNQKERSDLSVLCSILFSASDAEQESLYHLALRVRSLIERFREYQGFCAYVNRICEQGRVIEDKADEMFQLVA